MRETIKLYIYIEAPNIYTCCLENWALQHPPQVAEERIKASLEEMENFR